ncbi:competence protein CoiA family protein [Homoserinimonas sp. A447]
MTHSVEEIQQFRRGERRHLFAAYRDGREDLYFIENGTADAIRDFTKTTLRCAVADCADPDLIVIARRTKRQGFAHKTHGAGNHGPESEFHIAAKGVIQRWAAAQDATVVASLERDPDGTRARRTDVHVEWPDGSQVAFEPQYSNVTIDNWTERHDWYEKNQIPDVWLFGHGGSQLRTSGTEGFVKLNAVQLAAARTRPMLWINPQQEQVATIDVSSMRHWNGTEPIRGKLLLIPVDECELTKEGLTHPEIDRCHAQLTDLIRETEERRAALVREAEKPASDEFSWAETAPTTPVNTAVQQNAWDKALKAHPKATTTTASHKARHVSERHNTGSAGAWSDSAESRNRAHEAGLRWLETPDGQAMTSRLGSSWPAGLPMWPVLLPLPTHQWQGFIYERFVLMCEPGAVMDESAVVDAILSEFAGKEIAGGPPLDLRTVRWAVKEWHQHAAGVLIKRLGCYEFTRFRADETPPLLPRFQLRP